MSRGYFATSRGFLFQLISAASSSFWAVVTNAAVVAVAGVDVAAAVVIGTGINDVR